MEFLFMILPNNQDAIHKAWLYRLLSAIYDEPELAQALYFKGGTCAAMLGWLDRFSVDLDFDFIGNKKDLARLRQLLEGIFIDLDLAIKDSSRKTLQYFLKYDSKTSHRNSIKIDTTFPPVKANDYRALHFAEIDRIITCQTKETMFANKLIALYDRHKQREKIAGRDLYDIHYFFMNGFSYNTEVIKERWQVEPLAYFKQLADFIEKKINQKIIDQDINILLTPEKFQQLRKLLKKESLMFLKNEIKRLETSS